jgi:hypothetical protein
MVLVSPKIIERYSGKEIHVLSIAGIIRYAIAHWAAGLRAIISFVFPANRGEERVGNDIIGT